MRGCISDRRVRKDPPSVAHRIEWVTKAPPKTVTIAWTAVLLALVPAPALACPVCGAGGTSENAWAYTAMSVVLSVLPLGMIGGAVYWVARRTARFDAIGPVVPPPGGLPAHRTEGSPDVPQHQDALQLRARRD